MKNKKVDSKIRVGGSATIPHGGKSGGMGPDHDMAPNVHHVERTPSDAGQFDQHTGQPDCGGE
jgi:hypothetical protein